MRRVPAETLTGAQSAPRKVTPRGPLVVRCQHRTSNNGHGSPSRVLALESSAVADVPLTRVQQAPCLSAPVRTAYNDPGHVRGWSRQPESALKPVTLWLRVPRTLATFSHSGKRHMPSDHRSETSFHLADLGIGLLRVQRPPRTTDGSSRSAGCVARRVRSLIDALSRTRAGLARHSAPHSNSPVLGVPADFRSRTFKGSYPVERRVRFSAG
jgi:hypothetical protein